MSGRSGKRATLKTAFTVQVWTSKDIYLHVFCEPYIDIEEGIWVWVILQRTTLKTTNCIKSRPPEDRGRKDEVIINWSGTAHVRELF